jgi:hypothetical protein
MTEAPPQAPQGLPLYFKSVVPLQSTVHAKFALKERMNHPFAAVSNAIPITVDEFAMAQRHYPIVFGPGPQGAPLALVGLTENENLFVDADGKWRDGCYIPAYVRRYPFILARLAPAAKELSLCFDDQSGLLEEAAEGNLFTADGKASETTDAVLKFCEQFEMAIQRTRAFMQEMTDLNLLMEGEANVQGPGGNAAFRGFQMIAEDRVQNLRGDQARKLVKSGAMGLVYAHFFSLGNLRDIFAEKLAQNPQAANNA